MTDTPLFRPEWVTAIHYGGHWEPVHPGSLIEFEMQVENGAQESFTKYIDFVETGDTVMLASSAILAYKFKIPESKELESGG